MKEDLFTPNCIRTFTGQYVNVIEPDPDTIMIEDIAHSLSMQVRFGGHLPVAYTVAEHCLRTVQLVGKENREIAFQALMHDASEAYLLDFPSPIKKQMPEYYSAENRLMHAIGVRFGFMWPAYPEVKRADADLLQIEWDSFMLGNCTCYLTQRQAKDLFLQAFKKLNGKTR